MLAPDTVLQGRYRIVRQLGQGGMGAVFEAIDERLDTTVALKETFFADERLRKQFEREARLLARLHHPALPRVSDHFSEAEGQFLVMQFIGGEDLADLIARRRGPFPEQQILSWADQLLDALDYLHTQDPQIIHRDIKPQNLKLTSRGQIILLDFGLAKGQASEVSRVTTSASIFGYTPNYAPLEQVQGLGTDPRSDIYALSATLYHLLTGVKPPDALTRAAAIVNGQPDPLLPANEVNSAVSVETAKALQKAMSQNREHRFSTAAAMRQTLQNSSGASTVTNRTEADTVLFPTASPSVGNATRQHAEQPTVPVGQNQPTVRPGETTVVRPAVPVQRRMSPALLAILGVVVVAAGVLGYIAYRNRNNSQAATPLLAAPSGTPTITAHPEQEPANSPEQASANAVPENTATPAEATAAKKEKTHEKTTAKQQSDAPAARVEVDPEEPPETLDIPNVEPPNVPNRRRGSTVRTEGGVTIRTFADGSQLITSPDGSRILVHPDGRRQVFGPRRPPRRRVPPKY
jgi:serine/threonine protein kinase